MENKIKEIVNKKFNVRLEGYDILEVESFIDSLSELIINLDKESKNKDEEIKKSEKIISDLKEKMTVLKFEVDNLKNQNYQRNKKEISPKED